MYTFFLLPFKIVHYKICSFFLLVYLNCVSILCWTMKIIIGPLIVRKSKVALPIYVFILSPFLQFPLYFHVHFLSFPLQNSSQQDLFNFLFVYLNCVCILFWTMKIILGSLVVHKSKVALPIYFILSPFLN